MINTLTFAHAYWPSLIQEGDTVIDATLGNGHDFLLLAQLINGKGKAVGYDIQETALSHTKKLLNENLTPLQLSTTILRHASHEFFLEESAKLIVYNLGYLPGGDKSITTLSETTIKSLKHACEILLPKGVVSVTCYPAHPEGEKEESALFAFIKELSSKKWSCSHFFPLNKNKAPHLFLVQKVNPT